MPDVRTSLAERLALPPAPPRGTPERDRWETADTATRRAWARASTAATSAADAPDRDVVAAVAARRVRTGWRLHAVSLFVGWLVLMTIWGFGRSGHPDQATWYLVAGLIAGAALAATGVRRSTATIRRARAVSAVRSSA